jgi:hypothetical protein
MKYYVNLNKKYSYVKVYRVIKKINENTNSLSRAVSGMVDRFILKRKKPELE